MSYGVPAGTPASQVPVCPRHPDRVSYIRCQRCGRPTCPECQHNAAVGVQCVDCFAQQRRTQPAYRTVYGGRTPARSGNGKPAATITIMVICAAVYLLQLVVPGFTRQFTFAPNFTDYEPWRLLTSAFLHSTQSYVHIIFNLYALWFLGRSLEPLFGRTRFVLLYLISALGGSVGVIYLADPGVAVVGASGAIFGLFGALFVVIRQRRGELRSLVILLVLNLAIGFIFPGIAWQAHVGGLVTGAACAAIIAYAPKGRNRSTVQFLGLAAVVAVLVLAAVLWPSPV